MGLINSLNRQIKEIRLSATKPFAHVDFVSSDALQRALKLNGNVTLFQFISSTLEIVKFSLVLQKRVNDQQGTLRVEKGKPRTLTLGDYDFILRSSTFIEHNANVSCNERYSKENGQRPNMNSGVNTAGGNSDD